MRFLPCKIGRDYLNFAARCASIKPMIATRSRHIFQAAVSIVAIVAWFGITNHCALGALVTSKTQSPLAPMHCHGNQPSPSKKTGDEEIPCCKMLRATVTGEAKIIQVATKDYLPIQSWIVAEIIFAHEARLHRAPQGLDTGPPFAASFAESVLQRSVLAHAPPFLA
jgi:hypothetical protein